MSSAVDEQLAYYRAVADEYEHYTVDASGHDELSSAIDSFRPTGDVLELACGSGVWTERLQRTAASVTAVDWRSRNAGEGPNSSGFQRTGSIR